MQFLLDTRQSEVLRRRTELPELVLGQLCTPLTRYDNWGGTFAIDNGAYSGLDRDGWFRILAKHEPYMQNCLFCVIPDIVGNARRTDELFFQITQDRRTHPYNSCWAYVVQDGHEDRPIPWAAVRVLFVGGTNRFKDSAASYDIVKTAKALGIHVHVGRVNTWKRYKAFADLGTDTCDGSGAAKYDHMLNEIAARLTRDEEPTLFDGVKDDCA